MVDICCYSHGLSSSIGFPVMSGDQEADGAPRGDGCSDVRGEVAFHLRNPKIMGETLENKMVYII